MDYYKIREKSVISPAGRGLLQLIVFLFLSGCMAVGPDYRPPVAEENTSWHAPLDGGLKGSKADPEFLAQWWTTFNDPELTGFIKQALEGNLDLGKARSRVREARARRGVSRAERFPDLKADAGVYRSQSSESLGTSIDRDLYQTGFDASWELDLFGGIERSIEAADANLAASREALAHVWVSLAAEVALNYVEIRSYQNRLEIARANLSAQQESFDLARRKFEAGLTGSLDLEQALYNLESTRSNIPTLHTGLVKAKNRLAVLLGEHPGSLDLKFLPRKPIPGIPLEVAVGIPADLLRRRPDVRQAERELAAQTARIGVATARLYPTFTLSGSIGLEALSASSLFNSASTAYGLGPAFRWNIFNAGAIRQNIRVETALQEQALIRYETAILLALEEVENSLTAYAQEQIRLGSLENAAKAARRAVEIARDQYQAGLVEFQQVLEAQRSLLNLEDMLAQSREMVLANLVSLYKALGGGWTPLDPLSDDRKEKP